MNSEHPQIDLITSFIKDVFEKDEYKYSPCALKEIYRYLLSFREVKPRKPHCKTEEERLQRIREAKRAYAKKRRMNLSKKEMTVEPI